MSAFPPRSDCTRAVRVASLLYVLQPFCVGFFVYSGTPVKWTKIDWYSVSNIINLGPFFSINTLEKIRWFEICVLPERPMTPYFLMLSFEVDDLDYCMTQSNEAKALSTLPRSICYIR